MPHHHLANGVSPTANGGVKEPPAAGLGTSLSLRQVCLQLQAKLDAFLAQEADTSLLKGVQSHVREAISVIDEALERYSIEELSLSYNGGKDCLVLLVLILACLPRHFEPPEDEPLSSPPPPPPPPQPLCTNTTATNGLTSQIPTNTPAAPTPVRSPTPRPFPASLQSVYIVAPDPFAEVDAFVEHSAATYHLDLCRYALPMRAALDAYLRDRPRLRAVFVGTRRTDPHGASLTHFDPTDGDWPAFVRVHPVIDWHYAEIWAFLRNLGIPYISLYDQGYTSLGGTKDTHPNPLLKRQPDGAADAEGFRPAYELVDDDEERLGRDR